MTFEEKLARLADPATGILGSRRIERVPLTRLSVAIGSVRIPRELRLSRAERLGASGKGIGDKNALRTLTLEAAERYSAVFDGTEPLMLGTIGDMSAFPLEDLLQFSGAQYAGEASRFARPSPGDELLWAPARSLIDGREVPVPAACVYLDYTFEEEPWYCTTDTSACAAANSFDSAIRSAAFDGIERDALAMWWYNQAERPELVFGHGELEGAEEAVEAFHEAGRELHLFDLTNDLGVPVVAATSAKSDGSAIYIGAAADCDKSSASRRAIEELLQFWHWDRITERVPSSRRAWIAEGNYHRFPFLQPRLQVRAELLDDVDPLKALARRGFCSYVVDLTRSVLAVPVVRVVTPRLRHYGRRFGPGRLYRVPVELGWIAGERNETELNPYAVPL